MRGICQLIQLSNSRWNITFSKIIQGMQRMLQLPDNKHGKAARATQTMPKKTLHLVIHGRVQGVYFRDSMRREAQRVGIAGWVRNRIDGLVEAAVQGESADVDAIVYWTHRGPESAHVERVEIELDSGSYTNFEIIG